MDEGGDGARRLAVVVWQAEEGGDRQGHEQHGDGEADCADERPGRPRDGDAVAVVGAELSAPVPQAADVDLLDALHGAGADDPCPDGGSAWGVLSSVPPMA